MDAKFEAIIEAIDELVIIAVEADVDDLSTVIKVHDKLMEIVEALEETQYKSLAVIAQKAAEESMKIVLQEAENPEYTLDIVIQTTSTLQCMAREIANGGDPSHIPIPDGLGLTNEEVFGEKIKTLEEEIQEKEIKKQKEEEIKEEEKEIETKEIKKEEIKEREKKIKELKIEKEKEKVIDFSKSMELIGFTPSHIKDFIIELKELTENGENTLLSLESEEEQKEYIRELFGIFHTIKGMSGILKLEDLIKISHEAESLLEDKEKIDEDVISVLFKVIDIYKIYINVLSNYIDTGKLENLPKINNILNSIEQIKYKKEKISQKEEEKIEKKEEKIEKKEEKIEKKEEKIEKKEEKIEKKEEKREEEKELKKEEKELKKEEKEQDKEKLKKDEVKCKIEEKEKEKIEVEKMGKIQKEDKKVKKKDEKIYQSFYDTEIRIDIKKLDELTDMVGELVIIQSMIENDIEQLEIEEKSIFKKFSTVKKIITEIQSLTMSMRMINLKSTFQSMKRVIRDIAVEQNKKVETKVFGEHTEIDRNIIEEIYQPLIHLVRNAIDHGIEPPEERKRKGKPEKGRIELKAYYKGSHVVIEIKDDGQGISNEKIIKKAKEKGLLEEDKEYTDKEIYDFMFLPGFSTSDKLTSISGRGIGLDVVKKTVETLRGHIEVESQENKGSIFRLYLPLTLAIIDGMIVKIENERYIIPTSQIEEFVQLTINEISTIAQSGKVIMLRGEVIPVFCMKELLNLSNFSNFLDKDFGEKVGLITQINNKKYCFLVDELIGQKQIVIKSLGKIFYNLKFISGAAILGDGKVGLILDLQNMLNLINKKNAV